MGRIEPIRIPTPIIRQIPPPVTQDLPPLNIPSPVVDVPNPVIEYPVIDVPTRENFEGMIPQQEESKPNTGQEDVRELPAPVNPTAPIQEPPVTPTQPVIEVGGVEVPLPPVAPLVTAGATAVVAAGVTMGATIVLNQVKDSLIGPALERMKKRKVKIKQKKPVLQYMVVDDGISVFEISIKGMKHLRKITDLERDLRDQIEIDPLFEYDNKLIIDASLKEKCTKEGQKRFKKHFCPTSSIVKKLSARLSF